MIVSPNPHGSKQIFNADISLHVACWGRTPQEQISRLRVRRVSISYSTNDDGSMTTNHQQRSVLGARVDATSYTDAAQRIADWAAEIPVGLYGGTEETLGVGRGFTGGDFRM